MLSFNEVQSPTDPRLKKIICSAEKHFQKSGYRRASIDEICKDANISKPTFYKYFNSKEELFFAVRVYLGGKLREEFLNKCRKADSASEKLHIYFRMLEEFSASEESLTRALDQQRELRQAWNRHPWSRDGYQSSLDIIQKIVTEGIATDEFRAQDPTLLAHKVVISVAMLGILRRSPPRFMKPSDSAADFVFDLLLNGIKKTPREVSS